MTFGIWHKNSTIHTKSRVEKNTTYFQKRRTNVFQTVIYCKLTLDHNLLLMKAYMKEVTPRYALAQKMPNHSCPDIQIILIKKY